MGPAASSFSPSALFPFIYIQYLESTRCQLYLAPEKENSEATSDFMEFLAW